MQYNILSIPPLKSDYFRIEIDIVEADAVDGAKLKSDYFRIEIKQDTFKSHADKPALKSDYFRIEILSVSQWLYLHW